MPEVADFVRSGLLPDRGEQVAAAPDGPDHGRLGRVRLDLAADTHDAEIHGPVEGFGIAGVGEFQQPLARQHALRVGREHFQEAEFGRGQRVLVALVVA